jgi:outer membrane protein assembly factor BamB
LKSRVAILSFLCLAILLAGTRVFYWAHLPTAKVQNSRIKWGHTLPEIVTSSPVIGNDGSIYVATRNGAIYALDRFGRLRWAYRTDRTDGSVNASGLMLDEEDNLYFSNMGKVFSLTASGKKRWEAECSPVNSSRLFEQAALGQGVVYTTCGDNLTALNAIDGRELWKLPIAQWNAMPVVLRNGSIVLSHDRSLVALDAHGNSLWEFPPPNYIPPPTRPGMVTDPMIISSPIAVGSDETLYMGSGDGEFSAFSSEGALKWTYNGGPLRGISFLASPVIASDNTILALSTQATLYAFTPDGVLLWNVQVGEPIKAIFQPSQPSPVLGSDGTIYVLVARKLVALSPAGKQIWELPLSADSPVPPTLAMDGTIYVGTSDGVVYAVRTASKGLMNSSWPKYQRDLANSGRFSEASVK